MNIYYVYAYLRKDGAPYYIGKGCYDRAFRSHRSHGISTPKDKSRIVLLEQNLTEMGSLALERRMIRWYGRKDLRTGILRNKTDGGDMPPSRKGSTQSVKTKEKQSMAKKGKPSTLKGRTYEEIYGEEKAKILHKERQKVKPDGFSMTISNARTGTTSSLRGRTYEEIYGVERARLMREARCKEHTRREPKEEAKVLSIVLAPKFHY